MATHRAAPRGRGAAVRTAVLLLPLEGAAGKECHRKWVVSVPMPLQYWLAASQDLTAKVHTIIRTTITQYYVHQAVTRGNERQKVQPGSVTFIQRFGGAINLNVSFCLP